MRVALISDMHGNAVGLEAALRDIERRRVDRIVCLGDVAAFGPYPVETAEIVRDLGCPVVMGNTDHYLFHARPEGVPSRIVDQLEWGAEKLAGLQEWFDGFAPTHAEPDVLCCHGSPGSFEELILPATPDDEVAPLLEGVAQPVVAGGHTHQPMWRHVAGRWFLNPGSTGLAFRFPDRKTLDHAEYAILDGLDVELRRVPFDLAKVYADGKARGLPHAERWAP